MVSYHFFPHYRAGVIRALAESGDFYFIGSSQGIGGIKAYGFGSEKFINAQNHYAGALMFQPKLILEAAFGKFDSCIFLANPNHLSTWLAALVCRLRRKRVVFWGHGFFSSRLTPKNRIRKLFFNLAHAFFTYGYRAKQHAIEMGFSPETVHVGFNSLDYERQLPFRENSHVESNSNSFRVACVSRLTSLCRYDMLIDACALAHHKYGVTVEIDFVGDGPERSNLEEKSSQLGIAARFHGAVYDEAELARIFVSADATVMPGKIGLTAMHSMMYGTPVISHDDFERQMPEVEAIVPGFTGNLFRYGDTQHLADVLVQSQQQFINRANVRDNCYQMIDRIYNPQRQLEGMLRALQGLPAEEGDDAFQLFGRYKT